MLRATALTWTILVAIGASEGAATAASEDGRVPSVAADIVPIAVAIASDESDEPRSMRVRGVVTYRRDHLCVIQDDTAGMFVALRAAWERGTLPDDDTLLQQCVPGSLLEVEGTLVAGRHTPTFIPTIIRSLGQANLPAPEPLDRQEFYGGEAVGRRVRARGVVQGVRRLPGVHELLVADGGEAFKATVPATHLREPETLIDAAVEFVGVAGAHTNSRGEFRGARLHVADAADITVLEPPTDDPFAVAAWPLERIAQAAGTTAGHRVRTRGTVTCAVPGGFVYLQNGLTALRVMTASAPPLAPGDVAEAAGFIDDSGCVAGLCEAVVRRIGTGKPPRPSKIDPATIVAINAKANHAGTLADPTDYEGSLIQFSATVVDRRSTGLGEMLFLSCGDHRLKVVEATPGAAGLRWLEPGSIVEVTGIFQGGADADETATKWEPVTPTNPQVLVRSAEDVTLVRGPPWWNPRRIFTALGATAAIAAAAGVWVVELRRQLAVQVSLVRDTLRREAVGEERRRIAREFHDVVTQGLAVLTLECDRESRQADPQTRSILARQRKLVEGLRQEARGFLSDLRDPAHVEGPLDATLETQLNYLRPSSPATIALVVESVPKVDQEIRYQLMRIAREAVTNAIKHAQASSIVVRLDATADGTGARLQIVDDGLGFDATPPQAEAGHFGLIGMEERARRIGAGCVITSKPGHGTTVVVDLPASSSHLR